MKGSTFGRGSVAIIDAHSGGIEEEVKLSALPTRKVRCDQGTGDLDSQSIRMARLGQDSRHVAARSASYNFLRKASFSGT